MKIPLVSKPAPGASGTCDLYNFQVSLCLEILWESRGSAGLPGEGQNTDLSWWDTNACPEQWLSLGPNRFSPLIILDVWLAFAEQRALTPSAPPRCLLSPSQHRPCSCSRGSWSRHMLLSQRCSFTAQCSKRNRNSPSREAGGCAWNGAAEVGQVFGCDGPDHQQRWDRQVGCPGVLEGDGQEPLV